MNRISNFDTALGQTILESLPVGLYVVDCDRRITLWSNGAEKISGYLRHEVIGRSCYDNILMHCDQHGTVLCTLSCPLAATIHDGRPRDIELYLRHKAGHRLPVYIQALPVRNDNGTIVGAVEIFEQRNRPADGERSEEPCRDCSCNLLDREGMEALLAAQFNDFEHRQIPFGLVSIQIENLHQFADMFGFLAVRAAIDAVTQTVARCVRRTELLGWWSDNRLLAILPNCRPVALPEIVERLIDLSTQTAISWWGERHSVKLTVGAAQASPGDTAESLLLRSTAPMHG